MSGGAKIMSEPVEKCELPWQTMQRRLAAAAGAEVRGYAAARQTTQVHWRFGPASGSWLSRTRNGVIRRRETAAERQ